MTDNIRDLVNDCCKGGKYCRRNPKDMFEQFCLLLDASVVDEIYCPYKGLRVFRDVGYGMNSKQRKVYLCNYERTK